MPLLAVLASGRTLVWRDTGQLFGPVRTLVVEALRDLRLPLWNPHEALGMPLFAQMMHGVLHPISLAAAIIAPGAGMDAFILVYVALAAIGAAVLSRELGASEAAAAAGGLAYGLSGYVLGMSAILTYLCAAATAPWTVAALRAAGRGARSGLVGSGIATAALLFAGDPQWAAVAALLGMALAIETAGLRGAARAALGIVAGTALAGVQVVPTLAFLAETRRHAGLTGLERQMWALAPWRMVEIVTPGFFGGRPALDAGAPVFRALGGPSEFPLPFAPSVFVGAIPIALAAAGLRASRAARVLGVAALVLLWLALGTNLGADQMLRGVPIWGSFRYAEKFVGPLTLCLAALAALGADRIETGSHRRGPVVAAAVAAFVLVGASLVLLPHREAQDVGSIVRARLSIGLVHAGVALGLLAAVLASAFRPAVRRRFPAIAAGLVFAQSVAAAPFALHAGARGVVEEHPLSGIARSGTLTRIAVAVQSAVRGSSTDLDEAEWLVAAQSRMGEASFNVASHVDEIATYTGLEPNRLTSVSRAFRREFGPDRFVAWRRFALTHVVVNEAARFDPEQQRTAEGATSGGRRVLEDPWGFAVWEVPHRPWAFFAPGAVEVSSPSRALEQLVQEVAAGSPIVVVEASGPLPIAAGRVSSDRRDAESLDVEADSASDGLLVVNDAFWPGWEATIDGRATAIFPADGLVRAVVWPGGRHRLHMAYRPVEVRIGWLVTLAGAVLLASIAVRERRRGAG